MSQKRPHDESLAKKMQALISQTGDFNENIQHQPTPFDDIPRNVVNPPSQPPAGGGEEPPKGPPDESLKEEPEDSDPAQKSGKERALRILWTVASTISMTVNVIVVVLLLLLLKFFPISTVKTTVQNIPPEIGPNTPLDLLKGLYDNFELMDNAHIETTITVKDEIPVVFTLGLNQNTTVVLSEAVTIPGARVALTTGGLNIFNAPATVTLPAGTKLPITLSLNVPVNEMIPIELKVPVDIALNKTDLHAPFTGLQDVVEPLYCLVKSDAMNASGEFICLKEPAE